MSRIRLEWNVESRQIDKSDSEDPSAKRARRRRTLRLIMLIGFVLALLALVVFAVRQRLLDVQGQLEQLLRETVLAEAAALRIGDVNAFLSLQDSSSEAWRQQQQFVFSAYGDIKTRHDLDLTGAVLDVTIDGERGRAVVEETIDGVRYAQVWFYRNSGSGWRHTAPDFSFWGAERTLETADITVSYFELDERFARIVGEVVGGWLRRGCEILRCDAKPGLSIVIVRDAAQPVSWAFDGSATLEILSPSRGRMNVDAPFDRHLQGLVAAALADGLINFVTDDLQVVYPHDAVYLRLSAAAYLSQEFLGAEAGRTLVDSLALSYGEGKVAELVEDLAPAASVALLQQIVAAPLAEAKLDWRDFVQWRLNTEADLIASGAESDLLSLYDTGNELVWQAALLRYQNKAVARPYEVLEQEIWRRTDGSPQLSVTVAMDSGAGIEEWTILFNLVENVWKRAN